MTKKISLSRAALVDLLGPIVEHHIASGPRPWPLIDPHIASGPRPWPWFEPNTPFGPGPWPWLEGLRFRDRGLIDFAGGFAGLPNPNGEGPQIGPEIRALMMMRRLAFSSLNPQPLPPIELAVRMAATIDAHVSQLAIMGERLGGSSEQGTTKSGSLFISDLVDWCGTMQRWELINALIRKLLGRKRFPPPPPPPPDPPYWQEKLNARELVVMGVALQRSGQDLANEVLGKQLEEAGGKLMDQGLEMMG
jgi:hypothetical protein